jgi:hypothetical protein
VKQVKLGTISWNWVSVQKICRIFSDLKKNMSTSEKAGKANPKLGVKLL